MNADTPDTPAPISSSPTSPEIPAHIAYPSLRAIEAIPTEHEGESYVGLRDMTNLTDQVTLLRPEALSILHYFNGEQSVEEIAEVVGVQASVLLPLVQHLDQSLLLHGETFENHRQDLLGAFDELEALPIWACEDVSPEFIDEHLQMHEAMTPGELFEDESTKRMLPIAGLVVPHLDLERGLPTYTAGYAALKTAITQGQSWDRVIVLGTNHFGASSGVCMCPQAFETPAGRTTHDTALGAYLMKMIGQPLTEHRLDHLKEHSLELQMPWIRHLIGDIPTIGFLVHDPTVKDGESYDGQGVDLDTFVDALKDALKTLSGRTLFIASADLSHIGPEFGDDEPNTDARLEEVATRDRQHLDWLVQGDIENFTTSMSTERNPTRWCTLGGMTTMWRMLTEAKPHLLLYDQATKHPSYDDESQCCVTSAAMVLTQS